MSNISPEPLNKFLGRWFENLGIGIVAGATVSFTLMKVGVWIWFFIAGIVLTGLGTYLKWKK